MIVFTKGHMPKIVLITGASSGFGAACARKFSKMDCGLILAARRLDKLKQLASELEKTAPCHLTYLDVMKPASITHFFESLPERYRNIDILINNAGLALGLEPADECDIDDWDRMVDTNIKGLMHMTRQVLPGMVARNTGHIVNIGSVAGQLALSGG